MLLITHILSSISVGIIFRFWKYKNNTIIYTKKYISNNLSKNDEIYFSDLGEILGESIMSSIKTITMIGGFIVLFSVILSILNNSNIISLFGSLFYSVLKIFNINNLEFSNAFITGILELTNGIMNISLIPCKQISINIILSAFLLGFGGISVLLQVNSIISKSNISIKSYFLGKLLHGFLAAFYTYILINCLPIFNLNL